MYLLPTAKYLACQVRPHFSISLISHSYSHIHNPPSPSILHHPPSFSTLDTTSSFITLSPFPSFHSHNFYPSSFPIYFIPSPKQQYLYFCKLYNFTMKIMPQNKSCKIFTTQFKISRKSKQFRTKFLRNFKNAVLQPPLLTVEVYCIHGGIYGAAQRGEID